MKVLCIADVLTYQNAGIYHYVKRFLDGLYKYGETHEYILFSSKSLPDYPAWEQIISPVRSYSYPRRIHRYLFTLSQTVRRLQPDLVIEFTHFGPFRMPPSVSTVSVIHDITPVTHPTFHPRRSVIAQSLILPRTIRSAKHLFAPSLYTKNELISRFQIKSEAISIVPPIIPRIKNQTPTTAPLSKPYILHVGTIEPRKNVESIIRMFHQLKGKIPALQLVLVGSKGWKVRQIEAAIKNSPVSKDIHSLGWVNEKEIERWYQHAAACVVASHIEGFGIPIVEAMQFQRPIIVHKHPSMDDACGEMAIRTDATDAVAFAASVYEEMSRGESYDYSSHLKKFSPTLVIPQIEIIFEQLNNSR